MAWTQTSASATAAGHNHPADDGTASADATIFAEDEPGPASTNPFDDNGSEEGGVRSDPAAAAAPHPVIKALFAFEGKSADELSFEKGDEITVLSTSTSDDGWYRGRVSGREGIFPSNHCSQVGTDPS